MTEKQTSRPKEVDRTAWQYYGSLYRESYRWLALCMLASFLQAVLFLPITLLSGGERQRIALTRALLRGPRLLILDEPTNHLDKESISVLLKNLRGLEGLPSVLVTSHNAQIVRQAELTYVLREGRIESIDRSQEVHP